MPISISELNQLQKLARTEFGGAFNEAPTSYQLFTSELQETEHITLFEWVGSLPQVREWVGPRHYADLENYDYSIRMKDWELTISHPYKRAWESSRTALSQSLKQKIRQLGTQFRKDFPAKQVIDAVVNGSTNLAYDGVAFFSNPTGDRTIDNLLTGSGTTVDNIIADIKSARHTMSRFTDDKGRALGISGNLALIPPELEIQFMEITQSKLRSGGNTNIYYGQLEYVVDARLSDTNDWYFFATNEFIKPIVFLAQGDVNMAVNDNTFTDKSVQIGADATGNVGYSFPHLAIKITNS